MPAPCWSISDARIQAWGEPLKVSAGATFVGQRVELQRNTGTPIVVEDATLLLSESGVIGSHAAVRGVNAHITLEDVEVELTGSAPWNNPGRELRFTGGGSVTLRRVAGPVGQAQLIALVDELVLEDSRIHLRQATITTSMAVSGPPFGQGLSLAEPLDGAGTADIRFEHAWSRGIDIVNAASFTADNVDFCYGSGTNLTDVAAVNIYTSRITCDAGQGGLSITGAGTTTAQLFQNTILTPSSLSVGSGVEVLAVNNLFAGSVRLADDVSFEGFGSALGGDVCVGSTCMANTAALSCSSWPSGCVEMADNHADGCSAVAAENYFLDSASPCVDGGVDPTSWLDAGVLDEDARGVSRPRGAAWDVGAFEH